MKKERGRGFRSFSNLEKFDEEDLKTENLRLSVFYDTIAIKRQVSLCV